MHFRPSQRAIDMMSRELSDQRRCSRIQLPIRAMVVFPGTDSRPQAVLLRDVSMLGAFFFCANPPKMGDVVTMEFDSIDDGEPVHVRCEGLVVRIENFIPGAAIGVASQFTKYEAIKPHPVDREQRVSYIDWSLEMVEQMFARRPELESCAWRIQGAA